MSTWTLVIVGGAVMAVITIWRWPVQRARHNVVFSEAEDGRDHALRKRCSARTPVNLFWTEQRALESRPVACRARTTRVIFPWPPKQERRPA